MIQARFLALAALLASSSTALAQTTIIDFGTAGSVGNGSLFSDPTGEDAPAGMSLNSSATPNTNENGRILIPNGGDPAETLGDLASIIDNPGVGISGWSNYRAFYNGGSDAMGFLEDHPDRLNVGVENHNGTAFANSSDFILVSDAYTVTGADQFDQFDVSLVAGTDSADQIGVEGPNSLDLQTFLVFDDTTWIEVGSTQTITGLPDVDDDGITDRLVLPTTPAGGAYTEVRLVFSVDVLSAGGNGIRGLLDDIQLIVTPDLDPPTLGDANGDDLVNSIDFEAIRANFFTSVSTRAEGDLNNSGFVDFSDYAQWKQVDPKDPDPALAGASGASVPEPSSVLLISLAAAGLVRVRQRRV